MPNELVDIKGYTKEELSKIKNYGDSLEWKKDNDLFNDYLKRKEEFIDKTRNYCPHFKSKKCVNYCKVKNKITDEGLKRTFLPHYQYYLGCLLVEKYEKKNKMKFDYILKFRERVFSKVPLDITNINLGIYFLKPPSTKDLSKLNWVNEAVFYGKRDIVIDLIKKWMNDVGSLRPDKKMLDNKSFDKDNIDRCFSPERQFAMFLTRYLKKNSHCQVFWWNVRLINTFISKSIVENQKEYVIY